MHRHGHHAYAQPPLRILVPAENPPYSLYRNGKNMRAQACERCGQPVDSGAGLLATDAARSGYYVFHYSCAPPELQQRADVQFGSQGPPTFTFDLRGEQVAISQPPGFGYDHPLFGAMRAINQECCRTQKVGGEWVVFAPLARAAAIQAEYEAAGFNVAVTDTLQSALEGAQEEQTASVSGAQERAANVEQILYDLGMETTGSPFTLYDYQRAGIQWLASRSRALLADDQGLGKTIQSAIAVPDGAPVLVVAPVSLLENWAREFARWRPERAAGIKILGGGKGEKAKGSFTRWPGPGETFITAYSRLPAQSEAVGRKPQRGTYLICDEAHNLKTLRVDWRTHEPIKPSSQQAGNFYVMSQAVLKSGGAVWIMTGTPLMNTPNELWSVLQQASLEAEAFGTFKAFIQEMGVPEGKYGLEWKLAKPPNPDQVREKIQRVMLRREKQDVLADLPPKNYQDIEVSIDQEAVSQLDRMADSVLAALEQEAQSAGADVHESVALLKAQDAVLQKVREGNEKKLTADEKAILTGSRSKMPAFEEVTKAKRILATAKIPAMLDIIQQYEERGEPLIVFSSFLAPLDVLAKLPGWEVITGKTKPKDRQKIVDAFQRGELKGIGGQVKAAGVGITLTRSANVIFVDKDWTPAGNVQAEDRAHRIGQFRTVNIVSLVANHAIDRAVNVLLDRKANIIRQTISAGKRGANEVILEPIRLTSQREIERIEETFDPYDAGFVPGPADPERALAEAITDRERQRQEEEREKIRRRRQPTAVQLARTDRRMPETPDEQWAAEGLYSLAAADDDFAAQLNDMGFSRAHTGAGHQMSSLIQMGLGLTEEEWSAALATARYHKAQLPDRPSASDPELADLEKARQRAIKRRLRSAKAVAAGEEGDGITLGSWVTLPDGRQAVVTGRAKLVKGRPTVWKLQARGGDKVEMTGAQIQGLGAGTGPARYSADTEDYLARVREEQERQRRDRDDPPPPPAGPTHSGQQTFWNPPWGQRLSAWPSLRPW